MKTSCDQLAIATLLPLHSDTCASSVKLEVDQKIGEFWGDLSICTDVCGLHWITVVNVLILDIWARVLLVTYPKISAGTASVSQRALARILMLQATPSVHRKTTVNISIIHTSSLIGHVTYNLRMSKFTALTLTCKSICKIITWLQMCALRVANPVLLENSSETVLYMYINEVQWGKLPCFSI